MTAIFAIYSVSNTDANPETSLSSDDANDTKTIFTTNTNTNTNNNRIQEEKKENQISGRDKKQNSKEKGNARMTD